MVRGIKGKDVRGRTKQARRDEYIHSKRNENVHRSSRSTKTHKGRLIVVKMSHRSKRTNMLINKRKDAKKGSAK